MGFSDHLHMTVSSTESEAGQLLLEKHGSDTSPENIHLTLSATKKRPQRRWVICTIATFALLNAAALAAMYLLLADRLPRAPASGIFPQREYEPVTFSPQKLHPGPEGEAQWEADSPKGFGYVIVEEPERYNLPIGIIGGADHNRYGVTWAHQYHCLQKLRAEFWEFIAANSTLIGKDLEDDDPDSVYMWHLAHCFDYLKQTITCTMDMTLEYPTLGGENVLNGYEIPHQCTKRSIYDEYMDEHGPESSIIPILHPPTPSSAQHHHDHASHSGVPL